MAGLTTEERQLIAAAHSCGLLAESERIAYAPEELCIGLAVALVPLTLGLSLLLCPCLWMVQHERTDRRLHRLRHHLADSQVSSSRATKGEVIARSRAL